MKPTFLLIILAGILTCATYAQQSGSTNSTSGTPPPGGGGRMGPLTPEEREELHSAHDAAFQADPSLETEGKELKEKMDAYQKKVDAAMIKADPNVAPLIAKMEAARQRHEGMGGPPPPPPGN